MVNEWLDLQKNKLFRFEEGGCKEPDGIFVGPVRPAGDIIRQPFDAG
jgi:hypothetical protein